MNEYLTMREVAERLKLRPQTIRRWVQTNEIPHYKIRKNVRFRPAEIEKWIEDGGAATKKPEPQKQGERAGKQISKSKRTQPSPNLHSMKRPCFRKPKIALAGYPATPGLFVSKACSTRLQRCWPSRLSWAMLCLAPLGICQKRGRLQAYCSASCRNRYGIAEIRRRP